MKATVSLTAGQVQDLLNVSKNLCKAFEWTQQYRPHDITKSGRKTYVRMMELIPELEEAKQLLERWESKS